MAILKNIATSNMAKNNQAETNSSIIIQPANALHKYPVDKIIMSIKAYLLKDDYK
ncbi:unnamed protein product, partial [marine sediment metagenome]